MPIRTTIRRHDSDTFAAGVIDAVMIVRGKRPGRGSRSGPIIAADQYQPLAWNDDHAPHGVPYLPAM